MLKTTIKVKNVVVPCAGKGLRMGDGCRQKCMMDVSGMPVLSRVIDYWRDWCAEFIFVVPKAGAEIEKSLARSGINYEMVVQDEPDGVANAVLLAEKYIGGKFILALGDCLFSGMFSFCGDPFPGVGVWRNADGDAICSNYGVIVHGGNVVSVEEKPVSAENYFCGIGAYFFNTDIFDVIRSMPETGGKKEITSLILTCLQRSFTIKPVYFEGSYFNINTHDDLEMSGMCYAENQI